jgi:2-polyprenyl-6-methoxyphenol hydroxylase-like FAD-dependent oxidoreductase
MSATTVADSISRADSDRIKTLIIGAGVAGLTLAALMRQRGEFPIIIERSADWISGGYMLGLYPIGSRVLHGLGLYEQYLSQSVTMNQYQVCDGHGSIIQSYDLQRLTQRFGPMQGIERSTLVEILTEGVKDLPIHTETTVESLEFQDDKVTATFSDGTSANFDLVVGADGLHSNTRSMILDAGEYNYWDSKWGGWVFWADASLAPSDVYTECWGAGHFVGLYPTKNQIGIFVGGPLETINQMGQSGFIEHVQSQFGASAESIPQVLKTALEEQDSFFWSFHDCRSHHWRNGRVILLGDAAAGFLPTAGVGASMAMESAAALSDELSRTNAERVEQALDLYEKRHRRRVEEAQKNSRELARIMFVQSKPVDWLREQLLKFYSVEDLIRSIARIMEEPI